MVHSMSGGVVREKKYFDFAKVRISSTGDILWYISKIKSLNEGDVVEVPYGSLDEQTEAVVLRIDRHISQQVTPIPVKRAKCITRKL